MAQAWAKINRSEIDYFKKSIKENHIFIFGINLKIDYFIRINQFLKIFLALPFPFQQFFEFLIMMLNS